MKVVEWLADLQFCGGGGSRVADGGSVRSKKIKSWNHGVKSSAACPYKAN